MSIRLGAARRRRSPLRRALAPVLTVLGIYAITELLLFAIGAVYPHPASWRRAQAERDALLVEAAAKLPLPDPAADPRLVDLSESLLGQEAVVVHPYLGYVRSRTEQRGGRPVPPDSLGFETDSVLRAPDPGKLRIAVVGGSVAKHFGVYAQSRLGEALANGRFAGREVEVLTLAMGGVKQPQQLMALAWLLSLGGSFDVVLNLDGFNEVALYPFEREKLGPYFFAFPRNWPLLSVRLSNPDRRRLGETEYIDWARAELAQRHSSLPWRYLTAANALWVFRDDAMRRRKGKLEEYLGEEIYRTGLSDYARLGPQWSFADDAALYAALTGVWAESSRRLADLSRGAGIEYYHFLQPNQYLAGSKPIGEEERQIALLEEHPYREGVVQGYPRLIEAGARLAADGIGFHDLTQLFAAHPEPLYMDSCCHLNDDGQAILLREVVRVLEAGPARSAPAGVGQDDPVSADPSRSSGSP